jgi:hypothetical protein
MNVISLYSSVNNVSSHDLDGQGSFRAKRWVFLLAARPNYRRYPLSLLLTGKRVQETCHSDPIWYRSLNLTVLNAVYSLFSFCWLFIEPSSTETKLCRAIGWLMNWKGFGRKRSWLSIGKSRYLSDGDEEKYDKPRSGLPAPAKIWIEHLSV